MAFIKSHESALIVLFQTLWTSSEAEAPADGAAPEAKKEEAPATEGEKPAE